MNRPFLNRPVLVSLLFLCPLLHNEGKNESNDVHDDPVKVVQAVIDAAKSGDFTKLGSLCDPNTENDGDTKRVCTLSSQPKKKQDEFVTYFKTGKIIGSAEINGDTAAVKFKFGPDGTRDETMNLIRRKGKWYLYSF
jgi:hypothetical protein